jgi:tight adherence protein B
VQDNLKDLEKRQHEKTKKTLSMKSRLVQAGLTITVAKFYLISAIFASVLLLVAFIVGVSWMVMVGVAVVAGLGLPRWVLGFLIKRRQNKFLNELPNALDVIIRSIKSGLPLNDAIRLIATEGTDPVKSEFRRVIEAQQVGLSIPDACARMTLHMPLQEVNFFAMVIAIQSQAGGNLSEAIGNLSKVLRDRRKMKAKVTALSMEAKASAYIIGALPFIVATLVYLTSPNYMMILFTDPRGHFIMGFSAIWMSIGIFVMRKMISFDI